MAFDFLRLRNIFDPNQMQMGQGGIMPPSPDLPGIGEVNPGSMFPTPRLNPNMMAPPPIQQPMQQEDEATQINTLMRSLYTPEHDFSDRLKGLLDTIPQRPDHISGLRKIGSVLVGMGQGPEAQERATYAPYYRQMQDFNARLGPTIKGAELERGNNANERQMAYQFAQATNAARQQGTREDAERRRETTATANIARDEEKNRINRWKTENPDGEVIFAKDGFVHLVNPKTGKDTKTTVEHGKLTELEKAQWSRGNIVEAGNQRRITKQTPDARGNDPNDPRNWSVRDVYDDDGNVVGSVSVNKMTQEIRPIPKGTNVEGGFGTGGSVRTKPGASATQDAKSIDNRVNQWILRHPEDKDFFEKDPATNTWTIKEPGKFMGFKTGPNMERYNQMKAFVGGISSKAGFKGTPRTTKGGTVYYQED